MKCEFGIDAATASAAAAATASAADIPFKLV